MEKRINLQKVEPGTYKAMYALENYLQTSLLSKTHKDLLKIRASQINGCAYCINLHTKDAIRNGESEQRIFLLNAWRDTNLFTAEERIILELTEEITFIHHHGVSDNIYQQAEKLFDKNYLAQIMMAIITINAWNRIAISTKLEIE